MIKRILHIALLLVLSLGLSAQIVSPLGYGLEYSPEKISKYKSGVAATYINSDDIVEVQVWNGDFWYTLTNPPLPTAGSNSMGYLEIKDLVEINGELYLLAEHTLDLMPNAPNYILKWDGSDWTNLADTRVNNALVLNKLIVQGNKIQLVGIFSGDSTDHNIAEFTNGSWNLKGNLLTKNIANDNFKTVINAHNKTYVTGEFTDPALGTVTLAEWNGNIWQNTQYPAFLTDNSSIGVYNNQLVVYGNNSFSDEKVKIQSGTSWLDISNGLEDYTVEEIRSFKQNNNVLYAIGDFTGPSNESVTVMMYSNNTWSPVEANVDFITSAEIANNTLFVGGAFSDNGRLNNIGKLDLEKALIVAGVFNDKNENCIKDAGEEYIRNYPLIVNNEVDFLMSDKFGQLYLTVPKAQYTLNASAIEYWSPTCDDIAIDATTSAEFAGYNFGVKKASNIKDAASWITDNQSYVHEKGNIKKALVCVSNSGSADINGAVLELDHDNSISNFSSERAYDSYISNKASWTVNISAESELCFYVSFETLTEGEFEISTNVKLSHDDVDANTENNASQLKYKTGTTLINQKHCNNGDVIERNEEYLNYKIGFKNEGSQQAVDVKIIDVLDDKIVPSAKGMHYWYSHNCTSLPTEYTILPNGNWQYKFIWEYEDINLSNATGSESEGFLDFKIYLHPNTLKVGDEVCNTAKIYYSYRKGSFNEPITTNTVCSSVSENTGTPDIPSNTLGVHIGPIPATDILTVENTSNKDYQIGVYNTLGQSISNWTLKKNSTVNHNISDLPKGVYFIYASGHFVQKVIVY